MDHFEYRDNRLYAEDVDLAAVASDFGTPCYVYSRATLERHWRVFDEAFGQHPHLVCYAVKANSSLAVLNLFARMGSGFDIVSAGELARVRSAGGNPGNVVFSGVGKQAAEMRVALEAGIRCFNVESSAELDRLNDVAAGLRMVAPVSLRVNPDVDANTHPYIATGLKENKFGIDIADAFDEYRRAAKMANIHVVGVACHIGSQITELDPFLDALERVLALADRLREAGINLTHLDLGGGLGVRYHDETPPLPGEYMAAVIERIADANYEIHLEPGRAIAANAGVLLTRVEYLKPGDPRSFAIVDAAMNDLLRPALYNAWHDILAVHRRPDAAENCYDIVGPVCETGDYLGRERALNLQPGDLLAVRSAGAYGFTMASNYNSRPRPAEVMVDGDRAHLIRQRENIGQLMAGETILS